MWAIGRANLGQGPVRIILKLYHSTRASWPRIPIVQRQIQAQMDFDLVEEVVMAGERTG